jgi:Galactose oxidase, central domain
MICRNAHRFAAVRTLASAALFAIGLVATTPFPALAGNSGTWTITGSMATARVGDTVTLLPNGRVLVAGGESLTGGLTSAELYNPATGKWTGTGSMATGRFSHMAMLLPSGEVLVAGGIVSVNNQGVITCTAEAELYNPSTGQWTTTGSMTTPRYGSGATLLQNGQGLVAGGVNPTDGTLASAELYNPTTGTWTATGSMNYARRAPATLLATGQVLMAGGNGYTAELYHPSQGHWTLTSSMKFNHGGSAALLTNGDVLMFGGNLASYAGQFYNPSTDIWAATHNIGVNPPAGPLTLLRTGKVLLAGGESGYGTDTLCRLYDSSTNSWLLTGSMNQARAAHTATLLQNGQVLVAGGSVKNQNGTFTILASAELYTP